MKLVLARLIFNFDFELADPKDDWFNQSAFVLWDKKPLLLKVKERQV
jgi:hypothetical protein